MSAPMALIVPRGLMTCCGSAPGMGFAYKPEIQPIALMKGEAAVGSLSGSLLSICKGASFPEAPNMSAPIVILVPMAVVPFGGSAPAVAFERGSEQSISLTKGSAADCLFYTGATAAP